jgi:D-arabinose 1-dehydrogenase-like Zn-dependent alcohol dehydrogenase
MFIGLHSMVGVTTDGGFADYTIIESRSAAKLPDDMKFEQAAPLMCAGVTIYTAIKKAEQCGLPKGGVSRLH